MNIDIRKITMEDLQEYEHWSHPDRLHHKFNGPYYKHRNEEELKELIKELKVRLDNNEEAFTDKEMVVNTDNGELIGQVNWYWKSKETNWLEVGIVIFNENYWGMGLGKIILEQWINMIFDRYPALIRIGLTTWSGNERMMKLAEKLGMRKEAVYRKARIVDGEYYDSVSYGVLKEEWNLRGLIEN